MSKLQSILIEKKIILFSLLIVTYTDILPASDSQKNMLKIRLEKGFFINGNFYTLTKTDSQAVIDLHKKKFGLTPSLDSFLTLYDPSEKEGMLRSGSSVELYAWMTDLLEQGTLYFAMTVIEKHNDAAYWRWCGLAQPIREVPPEPNMLLRVYSMTKPVTSQTALLLKKLGNDQS